MNKIGTRNEKIEVCESCGNGIPISEGVSTSFGGYSNPVYSYMCDDCFDSANRELFDMKMDSFDNTYFK